MANVSKKTQKKIIKYIKKLPNVTKIIAVVVLLISLALSFSISLFLQRNDKFELKGEKTITLFVNEKYKEPEISDAIECISFGQDITSKVYINLEETTFNEESLLKAGKYYIVYEVDSFKYSSIQRIREIVVNEVEISEDKDSEINVEE